MKFQLFPQFRSSLALFFSWDEIDNIFKDKNNKIVVILNCSINSYENGEKSVMCNTSKVAIRHDIVYEIKENEFFLDYDEDISEITDLI